MEAPDHVITFAEWGAVIVIGLAILVCGVIAAVLSVRAGQYRDAEAAKFDVVVDDSYPTAPAAPTATAEAVESPAES